MRYFKAIVEYDGTEFSGFQWQHSTRTVQGELEAAIALRTKSHSRVTASGRTDAGVHALGQVISFSADTRIPTDRMAIALNSALPADVSVRVVEETTVDFSARFSASSRIYAYLLLNRRTPSALWRRYSTQCPEPLDIAAMQRAASFLLGEQDFAAFANELQPDKPTYRDVMRCSVATVRSLVIVRIEANAFLRGMVRCIVGTLLNVGTGVYAPEYVRDILQSRDRCMSGPSAPPQGLCLLKVRFGERKNYARREITEEL